MENEFEFEFKLDGDILSATLKGRLDATTAPKFMEAIKEYIGTKISKIYFDMSELDYIASAGLRSIVFAKQKIGYEADVILKNAQEMVVSVFQMSGLSNFVTFE